MKNKAEQTQGKVTAKLENGLYSVLPWIFTALALVFTTIEILLLIRNKSGQNSYEFHVEISTLFSGNPNIIALVAVICMFACLLIIPKSMLKPHKSGDGLGFMFMPLGLLGIFVVLSTIENQKDMVVGIVFGAALFIISALGTFKVTVKYVNILCIIMMFVGLFCILAGYMPYCYNRIPKFITDTETGDYYEGKYYYLSYFVRDVCLLLSYGLFSARISRKYKEISQDTDKKQNK